MSKVSDLLAARKPRSKTVRLVLDGGSTVALDLLKNELSNLKLQERVNGRDETLGSQIPLKERQILELEAEIMKSAVEFTFHAIGRGRLEELKAKFPPTAEQWDVYREQAAANPLMAAVPRFDPEGMAAEFLAACAVDPVMTVEEAGALWDGLSDGEAAQLWEAAWTVNAEAATVPLSATGIDGTGSSDARSTTRRVVESLGLSLPDES